MTASKGGNLFENVPAALPDELIETLAEKAPVRIERIVSVGHASPAGYWYDQDDDEWVAVLQGRAQLLFEGEDAPLTLGPGDYVLIPAHRRHRVEHTTSDPPAIWLAFFF